MGFYLFEFFCTYATLPPLSNFFLIFKIFKFFFVFYFFFPNRTPKNTQKVYYKKSKNTKANKRTIARPHKQKRKDQRTSSNKR